jgi:hypothetical protein
VYYNVHDVYTNHTIVKHYGIVDIYDIYVILAYPALPGYLFIHIDHLSSLGK